MLFLFKPRAFNGGAAPIPAAILGPWLEQQYIKRKKREEEEKQAREKEEVKEIPVEKPTEVEKVEDLAVEVLRKSEERERLQAYTRELEQNLLKFAEISARLEEAENRVKAAVLEAKIREEAAKEQIRLEGLRQAIAKKILEMQEEEEALLLLMMMD